LFRVVATLADGTVVDDHVVCVPPPQTGTQPVPPPLPQPPTAAEAWNGAEIPSPTIGIDPPARGITGLPTHLTVGGPTLVVVDATVRGDRIVGTATLDHATIRVDDGPMQVLSGRTVVFETKGNHTVTVGAVWRGRATLSGPDITPPIDIADIGTATITTTRTYTVHEVRSVLQP
jgi:hypothetical protein